MDQDQYKVTFETWDKLADLYQNKFMNLDLYNDTYDSFCEQITKINPKVLEIGCGPGNITKYLISKRPDFKIQAIDISTNMIELAVKNNPTVEFKVMDCREIDKIKTQYDGIICGFCAPYLSKSDLSKLIKDCKILLSDDGILYLSFVEGDHNNSGYQIGSSGDRMYFYYHNLYHIKNELHENGFEIMNLSEKNYTQNDREMQIHTIIIANK